MSNAIESALVNAFRTVLNMSITGAYIAAAIIILRLIMKKLPKRYSYALWAILGIRLLCPFSFSSAVSLFNFLTPETSGGKMAYIPDNIEMAQVPRVSVSVPPVNTAVNKAIYENLSPGTGGTVSINPMQAVMFVCAAIWLAGLLVMLVYTVISCLLVRRRVRGARLIRENIYICEKTDTPFVFGIIKPRIYLPEGLSGADTGYILAHERTHIKRGDHIVKLIAMLALCIHWFDPLVWVSYRLMTKDMELSCDERAVSGLDAKERKDYASALLNISARQNKLSPGGILAFGESGIKSRIKGVLNYKKPTLWIAVAGIAAVTATAAALMTNAVRPELPDIKNTRSYMLIKGSGIRQCAPDDIPRTAGSLEEFVSSGHEKAELSAPAEIDAEIRLFDSNNAAGVYSRVLLCRSGGGYYLRYAGKAGEYSAGGTGVFFQFGKDEVFVPADSERQYTYRLSEEEYYGLRHSFSSEAYTAFTGRITRVVSDGLYVVLPEEGGAVSGETFVSSDEPLSYGDSVEVCFRGEVMESAPQKIEQVWIRKLSAAVTGFDLLGEQYTDDNGFIHIDDSGWTLSEDYGLFRKYFFGVWAEDGRDFSIDDSDASTIARDADVHNFYFIGFYKASENVLAFTRGSGAGMRTYWLDINAPDTMYSADGGPEGLYGAFMSEPYAMRRISAAVVQPDNGYLSIFRLHEMATEYGIELPLLTDVTIKVDGGYIYHDSRYNMYNMYLVSASPDRLVLETKIGNFAIGYEDTQMRVVLERKGGEWERSIELEKTEPADEETDEGMYDEAEREKAEPAGDTAVSLQNEIARYGFGTQEAMRFAVNRLLSAWQSGDAAEMAAFGMFDEECARSLAEHAPVLSFGEAEVFDGYSAAVTVEFGQTDSRYVRGIPSGSSRWYIRAFSDMSAGIVSEFRLYDSTGEEDYITQALFAEIFEIEINAFGFDTASDLRTRVESASPHAMLHVLGTAARDSAETADTPETLSALAETVFGVSYPADRFRTEELYYESTGKVLCPGHGGAWLYYTVDSFTENDGVSELVTTYYADSLRLLPAVTMKYTLGEKDGVITLGSADMLTYIRRPRMGII